MPYIIPSDTHVPGDTGHVTDHNNIVDTITVLNNSKVDFANVVTGYGADPTGAADSTAAIQNALNSSSSVIYLPAGTYTISSPLTMSLQNNFLLGAGLGSTNKTGTTSLVMSGGFSGIAAVIITATGCQVQSLCIFGNSTTTTSNPIANGISLTGAKFCNFMNLFMQYINGWAIESVATATPNIGTSIYNVTAYNSAGGVHVKGVSSSTFQGQHSMIDLQLSQIGVATGANANLDAIFLEDCQDILTLNTNCAVSSASTGSTIHIKGACATHTHTNVDVGVFPTSGTANAVIKIEDSGNGSPTQITFESGVAQAGQRGLVISGGANQITFSKMWFKNNQTDGIQLSGTGFQIDFRNCNFDINGQGASGTQYDFNLSGTATGKVTDSYFNTPVVTSGNPGVQNPVNINSSGTDMKFINNALVGTGTTLGNTFTSLPSVIRNTKNYNPHGAQVVAVPGSGTATTALHYDAMFYVTANAGGTVSLARNTGGQGGGAGPVVVLAASAFGSLFVPAQTTLTPTYVSAPTWVVDGL